MPVTLNGTEILFVNPLQANGQPGAILEQIQTLDIANLTNSGVASDIVSTNITTVGNGTLTAAALIGGQIVRTGPVAAYTDTTDTAALILAGLPTVVVGATFFVRIKNATAFTQTLAAGAGVTLPPTVIIPAYSLGNYFATVTSTSAVTFTHMSTQPISDGTQTTAIAVTPLTTVGAGTITAISFVNGYTARSGAQSGTPFTDTTDTAANIIAACANLVNKIGASMIYVYGNTTNAVATIAGGTGVTVSGVTTVPPNGVAQYVITYTAAGTLTMVGIGVANVAINTGTFTANGASAVVVAAASVTATSCVIFGLKTVGGTPAGAPFMSAVTPGTGFSVKTFAGDTSVYSYQVIG